MGGPGFLGFKLGEDWLVFAIWGAGEWIKVDDLLVVDYHFEAHKRPQPWISNADDRLSPKLAGTEISSLDIQPRSLEMSFSNGMLLTINEAPEGREFLDGDDLRKAVFFAPTTEIWV